MTESNPLITNRLDLSTPSLQFVFWKLDDFDPGHFSCFLNGSQVLFIPCFSRNLSQRKTGNLINNLLISRRERVPFLFVHDYSPC